MEVKRYESFPHRPNVVGILKGKGNGPVLMMNDHMDTYPVVEPHKWNKTNYKPFEATREGDLLYARGSSDTRGNLACTILAAQALIENGIKLKGDLKAAISSYKTALKLQPNNPQAHNNLGTALQEQGAKVVQTLVHHRLLA